MDDYVEKLLKNNHQHKEKESELTESEMHKDSMTRTFTEESKEVQIQEALPAINNYLYNIRRNRKM